ncbi:hypothetical protein BY458DRAFT_511394 [Sporodiniella umbellata]|nr:hypothetical protein BY458DRAFT_511394 [Sporodiniella umbellata]
MTKAIITRIVGLFSSKQKKTTIEYPIEREHSTTEETLWIDTDQRQPLFASPDPTLDESDMSRFFDLHGDHLPSTQYYINEVEKHLSDSIDSIDEYSALSSATSLSSNITLEEALFSHISSDATSEATTACTSDRPKIALSHDTSNRHSYHIADLESSLAASTFTSFNIIFDPSLSPTYDEHYFCHLYTQALYYLSVRNPGYSPAYAFECFETIALQGSKVYPDLNNRTRLLISFAQYRAGRMLYEADYRAEEDRYCRHQQQGLVYLLESKKNGNPYASYTLGSYAQEHGDLDRASWLYSLASRDGLVHAKVSFGILVLYRLPNQERLQEAIFALTEAACQGHSIASLALALYYYKEQDYPLSMKYIQCVHLPLKSPIYGLSQYVMGIIYLKAGDKANAFQSIAKASESSLEANPAIVRLALRKRGVLTLLGVGVTKDPCLAFRWLEASSQAGDETASIILGQMYMMGLGCCVDRAQAAGLFERYKNNMAAKLSLGLLMMKFNPDYAYQEFLSVIQLDCTSQDEQNWNISSIKCEAAVYLAIWTFNGIGGAPRNPSEAMTLLHTLADQRHYPGAYYWIGSAYLEGFQSKEPTGSVSKDHVKAFQYFLKGCKQGNVRCLHQAGLMLQNGFHKHPDYQAHDAFRFFSQAAQLHHVVSQTQVGIYYFNGLAPVQRDLDKAFEYFSLAAKHNDTEAILYLADYLIQLTSHPVSVSQVYQELNRAASALHPVAYRMLAMVIDRDQDITKVYVPILENSTDKTLWTLYKTCCLESDQPQLQFSLQCLWKALALGDHKAGQHLSKFLVKMTEDDIKKTLLVFSQSEGLIPEKISIAMAQFLSACHKKALSLKKYLEVAYYNDLRTSSGWHSRLEAAKLVLLENQGKARTKSLIFSYLQSMTKANKKDLFLVYFLLGKCYENEICHGCKKTEAIKFYEKALYHKEKSDQPVNVLIEAEIRLKFVKHFYDLYQDLKTEEHLNILECLLEEIPENEKSKEEKAELFYYKGLLALHSSHISSNVEKSVYYLSQSSNLGKILARLELGYVYSLMEGREELADACFFDVEENQNTPINFQGRVAESMILVRPQKIKNALEDYPKEFLQMKFAAAITYSLFNLERQAMNWLEEIRNEPLAQILILYYKMKHPEHRTAKNIQSISGLMMPFEIDYALDYNTRMVMSYGQFRLGQCFELGHGVAMDESMAVEYYNKACAFLKNNEMYEKLAELSEKNSTHPMDLFPILYNAAHNNKEATFKLAQYYESQNTNDSIEKAIAHFHKAANLGHVESCYCYAKNQLKKANGTLSQEGTTIGLKSIASYLRLSANRNHGPSLYELGILEMKMGMFEDGVEDLNEADFLNHSDASYQLGELHLSGFIGVIQNQVTFKINQNYETSFKFFMRAYQNNSESTESMIKLGQFYEQGNYKCQNLAKARQWYMKALSFNQCDGVAEYALGCLEETNLEISGLSPTNALRKCPYDWFEKSYALGNRDGKFKVGLYLLHEWTESSDHASKTKGLQMLIEENNNSELRAMIALAKYFEKNGDNPKAFDYWRNAELLEDPEALEHIGRCYEEGLLGQTVSYEKANVYKRRAIEARKHAKETQCSVAGFKSDYSDF